MSPSGRRCRTTVLPRSVGVPLVVAAAAASAGETPVDVYARLSGEIVAEALLSDDAPALPLPPRAGPGRSGRAPWDGTTASATWVAWSDELGAAERFAGSGSGAEVRVDLRRNSAWGMTLAYSTVGEGVYSAVDDRPVRIERYLVGASRLPPWPRRWALSPGAGLAWNAFDFAGTDPSLDIEGAGAYAELRAAAGPGKRWRLEASGRAIYWRGRDGLGGSGAELSLTLGLGVGVRF